VAANRPGRPRASSRATLAEAASELFLERGYDATSIADITTRAGVSRSSFFNYFASKSDILWSGLDERLQRVAQALASGEDAAAALGRFSADVEPDTLALAIGNSEAMGLTDELERERAVREYGLAQRLATRLRQSGVVPVEAAVVAAAYSAALFTALWTWATSGAGTTALEASVADAVATARRLVGPVGASA
jgi:AcrR family transcriptional regulator